MTPWVSAPISARRRTGPPPEPRPHTRPWPSCVGRRSHDWPSRRNPSPAILHASTRDTWGRGGEAPRQPLQGHAKCGHGGYAGSRPIRVESQPRRTLSKRPPKGSRGRSTKARSGASPAWPTGPKHGGLGCPPNPGGDVPQLGAPGRRSIRPKPGCPGRRNACGGSPDRLGWASIREGWSEARWASSSIGSQRVHRCLLRSRRRRTGV